MVKQVPPKAVSRKNAKTVKQPPQQHDNRPVWRFSTVDKAGDFKWPKGQQEELTIVGKLHEFDSMTWSEIEGQQHHYLSPASLSRKAKNRLEEIELEDEVESLFSFHLQGRPRIVAIRHANVAHLLWYDPEHQVAPSQKKHT